MAYNPFQAIGQAIRNVSSVPRTGVTQMALANLRGAQAVWAKYNNQTPPPSIPQPQKPQWGNIQPAQPARPAIRTAARGSVHQGGGGGKLGDLLERAARRRSDAYQDYLKKYMEENQPAYNEYDRQMAERAAAMQQNAALFESRYGSQRAPVAREQYGQAYTTKPPEKTWKDPLSEEQLGGIGGYITPGERSFLSDFELREYGLSGRHNHNQFLENQKKAQREFDLMYVGPNATPEERRAIIFEKFVSPRR